MNLTKKEPSLLRLSKIVRIYVGTYPIFNIANRFMNFQLQKKVMPCTTILCQWLQIGKSSANSRNCRSSLVWYTWRIKCTTVLHVGSKNLVLDEIYAKIIYMYECAKYSLTVSHWHDCDQSNLKFKKINILEPKLPNYHELGNSMLFWSNVHKWIRNFHK